MKRADFLAMYAPMSPVPPEVDAVVIATEAATGQQVMLHFLDPSSGLPVNELLTTLAALPPGPRRCVLNQGDLDGRSFVVTSMLTGAPGLLSWLKGIQPSRSSNAAGVAAPQSTPTGAPPQVNPLGEQTRPKTDSRIADEKFDPMSTHRFSPSPKQSGKAQDDLVVKSAQLANARQESPSPTDEFWVGRPGVSKKESSRERADVAPALSRDAIVAAEHSPPQTAPVTLDTLRFNADAPLRPTPDPDRVEPFESNPPSLSHTEGVVGTTTGPMYSIVPAQDAPTEIVLPPLKKQPAQRVGPVLKDASPESSVFPTIPQVTIDGPRLRPDSLAGAITPRPEHKTSDGLGKETIAPDATSSTYWIVTNSPETPAPRPILDVPGTVSAPTSPGHLAPRRLVLLALTIAAATVLAAGTIAIIVRN